MYFAVSLERPQVGRVDALLAQRTVNGRVGRNRALALAASGELTSPAVTVAGVGAVTACAELASEAALFLSLFGQPAGAPRKPMC